MIRAAELHDAETVAAIYNHYILNTVITFEEHPVTPGNMSERMEKVYSYGLPWFVSENNGQVYGYTYAVPWSVRSAYRFSVESTVYIAPSAISKGLGTELYSALFKTLREKSIHVAVGCIALPNPASIALHEKFGMQQVAHLKEVGYKFNQWVDVGYWQVLL